MGRWPCCESHFASFPVVQADHHPNRRRARRKQRLGVLAKQGGQFIANDLDNLLIRRKLQHDFGAQRLVADIGEKLVHYGNSHVAFQHGFADFRQRRLEVLFGELALPTQVFECSLQLLCKVFKHGRNLFSRD
jgi:hypothetical protein